MVDKKLTKSIQEEPELIVFSKDTSRPRFFFLLRMPLDYELVQGSSPFMRLDCSCFHWCGKLSEAYLEAGFTHLLGISLSKSQSSHLSPLNLTIPTVYKR